MTALAKAGPLSRISEGGYVQHNENMKWGEGYLGGAFALSCVVTDG